MDNKARLHPSFSKWYGIGNWGFTKFSQFGTDVTSQFLKPIISGKNNVGKKEKRVSIPQKTKAKLQQQIHSKCPFCSNEDVDHFQYHHINGDRSNSSFDNLLMLCSNCHSKITKGDISEENVIAVKNNIGNTEIEFDDVTVDKTKCCWVDYSDIGVKNAFWCNSGLKGSSNPILQFHLINHSNKTIVLKNVTMRRTILPPISHIGTLSEPHSFYGPRPISISGINKMVLKDSGIQSVIEDFQRIQIPTCDAYTFQVQLLEDESDDDSTLERQQVLQFTFEFNKVSIDPPKVLLNTTSEKGGVTLVLMG